MLARPAFASQHFENVNPLACLAFPGSSCRDSEKIRQADQFSSLGSCRQRGRPTKQQRDATRGFKEVLFLPPLVVAEQIAMVGKETNQKVVGVRPPLDCVEDSPKAIVQ